jgi:hypothetical protein
LYKRQELYEVSGISGVHCGVVAVFCVVNIVYVGSLPVFLDSLSVQSSRVGKLFMECLPTEDGTNRLPQSIGKLPTYIAEQHRRAKTSSFRDLLGFVVQVWIQFSFIILVLDW